VLPSGQQGSRGTAKHTGVKDRRPVRIACLLRFAVPLGWRGRKKSRRGRFPPRPCPTECKDELIFEISSFANTAGARGQASLMPLNASELHKKGSSVLYFVGHNHFLLNNGIVVNGIRSAVGRRTQHASVALSPCCGVRANDPCTDGAKNMPRKTDIRPHSQFT